MLLYTVALFFMLVWEKTTLSYKILVYSPRLAYSHVNFMGRIADILVEAGYDVTVFNPDLNPDVTSNGSKLAKIIHRKLPKPMYFPSAGARQGWSRKDNYFIQLYKLYKRLAVVQKDNCQSHLEDEQLMNRLQAENFSLAITEQISFCGYAVFHRIGLRNYITTMAVNLIEVVVDPLGVSSNPSYVPAGFSKKMDKMTYLERLENFVMYAVSYFLAKTIWEPTAQSLDHQLPKFNYIESLKGSSLAFVNSEELLDFPRLISQKIIFVGGIGVPKANPLPEDYQSLMNKSNRGVVLVSFGTVVHSEYMTDEQKKKFEDTFRQLPEVTFIWKYENEEQERANQIPNLVTRKWVPQNDLLNHPKLLAFVSHCGQNSLTESVHAGVPLICIPLIADQIRNARTAQRRNVAIILDKQQLTTDSLASALRTIIYEKSYRKNAQRLAEMIRNKPVSARERVIRNTEFVLRFGPLDNFKIAGVELNFFQYYLLDVFIAIALPIIVIIYITVRIVFRFVRPQPHRKTD